MLLINHIVFTNVFLDEVHSTNDYAATLIAKSNPIEGTVISTYNQTAGKGQIGRTWFSDSGKNLTLSIILRPHFLDVKHSFYLSIMLALSVRCTIRQLVNQEVHIKWPNDIYVDNEKIAGLLTQTSIQGDSVINATLGVGVNVNQAMFPDYLPNPTSLRHLTKEMYSLERIRNLLLISVNDYYVLLREQDFQKLKHEYLSYLYRRGEMSFFEDAEGNSFQGEIIGITEFGKLAMHVSGKLKTFAMHEIKYLPINGK